MAAPLAPRIAVRNLLNDVRLLGERIPADLDIHRKIRAHVERRVDIDKLETPLLLDLLAQRPVFQRRKNQFVVAPDQPVRPALDLPPALVEQQPLPQRVRRGFGARLVHVLDHLKRQHHIANLVRLAVPDQLHLALFLEKQKTVLLGQRPVRLDETDDLLAFLFGQWRHEKTRLRESRSPPPENCGVRIGRWA
jgi:hypothetical protein